MISLLIILVQDYSYDKTLKLVDCYKSCVVYCNVFECIYVFGIYYGHRRIPNTTSFYIYSYRRSLNIINPFRTSHRLPKRYIYSNMHI